MDEEKISISKREYEIFIKEHIVLDMILDDVLENAKLSYNQKDLSISYSILSEQILKNLLKENCMYYEKIKQLKEKKDEWFNKNRW